METQRDHRGRFVGKTRVPIARDTGWLTIEHDRETGEVRIHADFAWPLEAAAMAQAAAQKLSEKLPHNRAEFDDRDED